MEKVICVISVGVQLFLFHLFSINNINWICTMNMYNVLHDQDCFSHNMFMFMLPMTQ